MTVTEFLLARIAEDEAVAKAARRDEHMHARDGIGLTVVSRDGYSSCGITSGRVLAECEAKRRIVEVLEDERQRKDIYNRDYPLGLLTTEGDLQARLSSNARWAGLEIAVRALALPYANHPDFDEAWRV